MAGNSGKQHGPDINKQQIGAIYASALLGVAEDSGTTDEVLDEFQSLVDDVLDELPDLDAVLSSPRVSHDDKAGLLDGAFAAGMNGQLLTFLKVVSAHGRLDCLRAIYRAARDRHDEGRGLLSVQLTTAEPVADGLHARVNDALRSALKAEVRVRFETDPALIGGMVVRVRDTVYDGSVANRLKRLRVRALEGTFQSMIGAMERFTGGT